MTILPHIYENASVLDREAVPDISSRLDSLSLRLPGGNLPVDFEYRPGRVIARDRVSGHFGEGKKVDRAVADLIAHMQLTLADLKAHESVLDPDLADDLLRLRFYLGE